MTGSNALPDSTYYGMAVELPSADRAAYFTYATVPSDTQKIFCQIGQSHQEIIRIH